MSDFGKIIASDTIEMERLLPVSAEDAWHYLTNSEKLESWLGFGVYEPRSGGRILIDFSRTNYPDHVDGDWKIRGVVSRCEPPLLLEHSWMTPEKDSASTVRFELQPRGEQVLLIITHSGLAPDLMALVGAGWHSHVDLLVARLLGREPEPFAPNFNALLKEYTVLVAAAAVVISTAAPALASPGSDAYKALSAHRQELLTKYDRIWKDADDLERQIDLLKRADSSPDNEKAIDRLDRSLNDKVSDLKDVELDLKDLNAAMTASAR